MFTKYYKAGRVGFEPTSSNLTDSRSAAELPASGGAGGSRTRVARLMGPGWCLSSLPRYNLLEPCCLEAFDEDAGDPSNLGSLVGTIDNPTSIC